MIERIAIYLNDRASGANTEYSKQELTKKLFRYEVFFREPNGIPELDQALLDDLEQGIKNFFILGGDGTCSRILQKIHAPDTNIFIVPRGTANDLATTLGVFNGLKDAPFLFKKKIYKEIDIIKINESFMATNGGIGVVAEISEYINSFRKTVPGFKKLMKIARGEIYNLALIGRLLSAPLKYYQLYIDSPDFPNLEKRISTPLLLINNQPHIGKNFLVAPETKNNDGKFNVTIFTHQKKSDFIKAIAKIRFGLHFHDDDNIITFETNKIDILNLADEPLLFFGDGEKLSSNQELKISLSETQQKVGALIDRAVEDHPTSYGLDEIELV